MAVQVNREKSLRGSGVGRDKRRERVERGFSEDHREVGCDMELKNQVLV